jgi:hypothetical protein
MDMEALLKKELEFRSAKVFGKSAGGCVSQGRGYMTDIGPLFVKQNHKPGVGCFLTYKVTRNCAQSLWPKEKE